MSQVMSNVAFELIIDALLDVKMLWNYSLLAFGPGDAISPKSLWKRTSVNVTRIVKKLEDSCDKLPCSHCYSLFAPIFTIICKWTNV
jgi:hypothetical protein